jgi:hypothetical protein
MRATCDLTTQFERPTRVAYNNGDLLILIKNLRGEEIETFVKKTTPARHRDYQYEAYPGHRLVCQCPSIFLGVAPNISQVRFNHPPPGSAVCGGGGSLLSGSVITDPVIAQRQ